MDQNTLMKIRNYGALKFSVEKMCRILRFFGDDKNNFIVEMKKPNSEVRTYYDQGAAIGDYNIDAELAKKAEKGDVLCIMELSRRQHNNQINQLKKDLFGI